MDIIQTGAPVDEEKDFCLERFLSFAKKVTDRLIADGHWSDYVDPCSGLAMVNKASQSIYGEVDALVTLLNYQTTQRCCKVVLHPQDPPCTRPPSSPQPPQTPSPPPSPPPRRKSEPRRAGRREEREHGV